LKGLELKLGVEKFGLEMSFNLLLVSEPHLGKTPLHMAAKSPSCLSLRILLSLDYVDVDVR
jgi:hypothetical protein